jgi:class 3 adenylate cyclase
MTDEKREQQSAEKDKQPRMEKKPRDDQPEDEAGKPSGASDIQSSERKGGLESLFETGRLPGLSGLSDIYKAYTEVTGPLLRELMLARSPAHTVGPFSGSLAPYLSLKSEREQQLEQEIAKLKRDFNEQRQALENQTKEGAAKKEAIEKLKATIADLEAKEALKFVLDRIHDDAKQIFLESQEFQQEFLSSKQCDAYLMAVDLRRSTELMLKSKRPELFAEFITLLCDGLRAIILEEQGVFDKFTGDGILAFFPDFYTGRDAGYRVVVAADKCHRIFAEHYRKCRSSFLAVLKDVGLCVGIDFGKINLVRVGQELAVVGTPVVYACRMADGPAGRTLLNQPAHEQIFEKFSAYCSFQETEIEMKHEGVHLGHIVKVNEKLYAPSAPAWHKYVKS